MKPQSVFSLVNSAALKVAGVNSVSVRLRVVPAGGVVPPGGRTAEAPRAWTVVPQAAKPGAMGNAAVPARAGAGLQVGAVVGPGPLAPAGPASVATSLTTMDVGTPGVRVLLIKSLRAERDQRAFGVT